MEAEAFFAAVFLGMAIGAVCTLAIQGTGGER